ncbi:MAG: hemerythrin domain-containing protein [Woeseia sp.]
MNNDLAGILAELRTDHRNMAIMLDVLEQESNKLYDGHDADFDLLHDVMRYMTVYPDAVHHPKEDLVYAELRAARPDLAEGLDRVPAEHRELADLGLKLRHDVESILSGTALRRNVVVADALRYVKRLREHMDFEESDLFVRLDELVLEGHSLTMESDVRSLSDPVFGPDVEKRFGKLFDSIQQSLQ